MKRIIIASLDRAACETIRDVFHKRYRIEVASTFEQCLEMFRKTRYEVSFIELSFLQARGENNSPDEFNRGLHRFWEIYPAAEIIVLSQQERIRDAVNAVKAGASNYLTYPVNPEEVEYVIENLQESAIMQSEIDYLRDEFWRKDSLEELRTNSPLMKEVLKKVRSAAPTRSTILLTGETGTGKGVLAKIIHQHSNRRDNQFISVHCGAIPDSLVESELFGHEKGSFTGAVSRKLGKFEIAQGGTIFLDEISTVTPSAQIKLLQVLQDRTFQRIGGQETIDVDVRVIAAANEDLFQMVQEGHFRRDLYYRLSVFPIELPKLKERLEDLPVLMEMFLVKLNRLHGKEIHMVHRLVLEAFQRYSWPGNIRELENLMERAYILETDSILRPDSFPNELFSFNGSRIHVPIQTSRTLAEVRRSGIEQLESSYLREILALQKGSIKESALSAGITARQFHKLITKYRIRKEEFKK